MSRLIALASLLLLAACVNAPQRGRVQAPEPRIAPADMQMDVSMVQRLHFSRGSHSVDTPPIDAQLEIDAEAIRFVGFAAEQRVLRFVWDGRSIDEQRGRQLPEHVRSNHILRDIQYVYAPIEALRATLPSEWSVTESSQLREIRFVRDSKRAAIQIRYADANRVRGKVRMMNWVDRYGLEIEVGSSSETGSEQ